MDGGLGLYVHLPFCVRRCDYCDFFVVIEAAGSARGPAAFLPTLQREIATAGAAHAGRIVDTVYLGGGTPSALAPEEIAAVLDGIGAAFDVAHDAEITLEANPEGVTPGSGAAWRAAGVTRVSLGVQSLHDAVLGPRGRSYTGEEALHAAGLLRASGPEQLNVDLIAGLPGETPASFAAGVRRLLELQPDHMSVYMLETEESGKATPLSESIRSGRVAAAAEDDLVAMYEAAVDLIPAGGLPQYEISNFARAGRASRHNLKYWAGGDYLGLGPSAHSCIGGRRWARPRDMGAWTRQVELEEPGSDYTLPEASQRLREALILALRLTEGVDPSALAARLQSAPDQPREQALLAKTLKDLIDDGLLERRGARVALTRRGLLLSNEVFVRLM